MTPGAHALLRDGIWRRNPALVQMLGLCPLLAVTDTLVKGLGLGIATAAVMLASNGIAALSGPLLRPELRLVFFAVILASLVSSVDFLMNAGLPALHGALGIFVPLIVCNCMILARAETFASRHGAWPALVDGLAHGAGFAGALITLGALREILGHATLLRDAEQLFGAAGAGLTVTLPFVSGFHLIVLPPGAFFALGLLVALANRLRQPTRRATRAPAAVPETA